MIITLFIDTEEHKPLGTVINSPNNVGPNLELKRNHHQTKNNHLEHITLLVFNLIVTRNIITEMSAINGL